MLERPRFNLLEVIEEATAHREKGHTVLLGAVSHTKRAAILLLLEPRRVAQPLQADDENLARVHRQYCNRRSPQWPLALLRVLHHTRQTL